MGEEYEAWKFDKDYNDVCNFLGISPTSRTIAKVRQRVDWMLSRLDIKKVGLVGAKTELQKLRRELGTNIIGESLVDQLFQSLRLKQEREKEIQNFGSIATPEELRKVEKTKQADAKAKEQMKAIQAEIEAEKQKTNELLSRLPSAREMAERTYATA